jgi:5-methylcytosine-specific restriction protein B
MFRHAAFTARSIVTKPNQLPRNLVITSVLAKAVRPFPEHQFADSTVIERMKALWDVAKRFQVLSGPPGTGKTRAAEDFAAFVYQQASAKVSLEDCRLSALFPEFRTKIYTEEEIREKLKSASIGFVWDIVVLHPQYSYEDLIRGFRAHTDPGVSGVTLVVREGVLAFMARVASVLDKMQPPSPLPKCMLVLDEINRAPIGQLFGEALYAIDRRDAKVVTTYPLETLGTALSIPSSLLIVGTMNSIDRATAGFDFALRRRFAFVPVLSSRDAVKNAWSKFGTDPNYGMQLYDLISHLIKKGTTQGAVSSNELTLGHAYFIPPADRTNLVERSKWLYASYVYQILPTLADYQEQGLIEFADAQLATLPLGGGLDFAAASAIDMATGLPAFEQALGTTSASSSTSSQEAHGDEPL